MDTVHCHDVHLSSFCCLSCRSLLLTPLFIWPLTTTTQATYMSNGIIPIFASCRQPDLLLCISTFGSSDKTVSSLRCWIRWKRFDDAHLCIMSSVVIFMWYVNMPQHHLELNSVYASIGRIATIILQTPNSVPRICGIVFCFRTYCKPLLKTFLQPSTTNGNPWQGSATTSSATSQT